MISIPFRLATAINKAIQGIEGLDARGGFGSALGAFAVGTLIMRGVPRNWNEGLRSGADLLEVTSHTGSYVKLLGVSDELLKVGKLAKFTKFAQFLGPVGDMVTTPLDAHGASGTREGRPPPAAPTVLDAPGGSMVVAGQAVGRLSSKHGPSRTSACELIRPVPRAIAASEEDSGGPSVRRRDSHGGFACERLGGCGGAHRGGLEAT